MEFIVKNWKEKYEGVFNTFNGKLSLIVRSSEKDKTKFCDIPFDKDGLFMLKTLVDRIKKSPGEKTEMFAVKAWDMDQKKMLPVSTIGIEKKGDLTYHLCVDTKVGSDHRNFKMPFIFSQKYTFSGEETTDRLSSEMQLGNFKDFLLAVPGDQALGDRDKKTYFLTETLNNVATKVGAEIAKPKFAQGGGNFGGGGQSKFSRPAPTPAPAPSNDDMTPPDDDIPF